MHFLMKCDTFNTKRACFMGKINSILPEQNTMLTILCPRSTAATKVVNKFIRIMCLARDNITEGLETET